MSVEIKREVIYSSSPEPEPNYEDLSPDSRLKRREQLEKEFETLREKRKAMNEIDYSDPMTRTVLVVGLGRVMPQHADFVASFENLRSRRGRFEGVGMPAFSGFEVLHEKNYKFQDGKWKEVEECFLRMRGAKETRFLVDLGRLDMNVREATGGFGFTVRFVPATQDDETRAKFRTVGGLAERLHAVSKDLNDIGIVRTNWNGLPTLSEKYIDKAVFDEYMVDWKRQRDAGDPLCCHSWAILQSKVPVVMKALNERMLNLYKEECYILMQLRELQSNGFDFKF